MLFDSSLRKELSRSFGVAVIVLVTVVMTMTLIRTLGMASRGSFNPSDVMLVMGYTVLAYLPTLLTMGLLIAIMATLSRMYGDHEMVIWMGSGCGLVSVLRSVSRFAWPVLAGVAVLALVILPWTNMRIEEMKSQYEKRSDIDRIEPGQFQESADGTRVFFVEKNNTHLQSGTHVFIAATESGKETMTSAQSGRIEILNGGRFIRLDRGQRLEVLPDVPDFKISEFEQYGLRVGNEVLNETQDRSVNTRTTFALLQNLNSVNLAELSWRMGLIFASINFVIIGVVSAGFNPRSGRSVNLLFALFSFIIYYNFLTLGQNWIATGRLSWGVLMISLHGGVFVTAVLWLIMYHNHWHPYRYGRSLFKGWLGQRPQGAL